MKKPTPLALVPLRIGGAPEEVADPLLELLSACHARIRRFARLALTVGARPELPPAEVKGAAADCLRYFTEALPLHARDEEDSLWPRLAGLSPSLDATMAQARAQHLGHHLRLAALVEALRVVQARPGDVLAHRLLSAAASALETDFEEHLVLEESEIFPNLELLSAEAKELIVVELRARRSGVA